MVYDRCLWYVFMLLVETRTMHVQLPRNHLQVNSHQGREEQLSIPSQKDPE